MYGVNHAQDLDREDICLKISLKAVVYIYWCKERLLSKQMYEQCLTPIEVTQYLLSIK